MPVTIPIYLDEGRHDRPSKAFVNMIRELEVEIADAGGLISPGLVIESRVDDPADPVTGQIWLITTGDIPVANHLHVIENRVDDPASPITGQVWVRTDL